MKTVEIFQTNIQNNKDAKKVILSFLHKYPLYKINIDLEDIDNVFRIETDQLGIEIENVIRYMQYLGYSCEPIE